jgi:hypothetical protein
VLGLGLLIAVGALIKRHLSLKTSTIARPR